jgi:EAL domain-containing protein (putative c-di-GMP-specific phosphodiesterase class I)
MPGAFIDTLATNAVALDVGRWIILTACQKAAYWLGMGLSPGRIGINVFPPQFQGDVLLKAIDDALLRDQFATGKHRARNHRKQHS